jgi:hypothetical protein
MYGLGRQGPNLGIVLAQGSVKVHRAAAGQEPIDVDAAVGQPEQNGRSREILAGFGMADGATWNPAQILAKSVLAKVSLVDSDLTQSPTNQNERRNFFWNFA